MNDLGSSRLGYPLFLSFAALLGSGCANNRQVVYPHGDGRVAKAKPRRDMQDRAPVVNVRVEDQARTLPPVLGD